MIYNQLNGCVQRNFCTLNEEKIVNNMVNEGADIINEKFKTFDKKYFFPAIKWVINNSIEFIPDEATGIPLIDSIIKKGAKPVANKVIDITENTSAKISDATTNILKNGIISFIDFHKDVLTTNNKHVKNFANFIEDIELNWFLLDDMTNAINKIITKSNTLIKQIQVNEQSTQNKSIIDKETKEKNIKYLTKYLEKIINIINLTINNIDYPFTYVNVE